MLGGEAYNWPSATAAGRSVPLLATFPILMQTLLTIQINFRYSPLFNLFSSANSVNNSQDFALLKNLDPVSCSWLRIIRISSVDLTKKSCEHKAMAHCIIALMHSKRCSTHSIHQRNQFHLLVHFVPQSFSITCETLRNLEKRRSWYTSVWHTCKRRRNCQITKILLKKSRKNVEAHQLVLVGC